MLKGLFKLLLRYVFASESIFFIMIMPVILFGIMGEAMIFGTTHILAQQKHLANSFIVGISGSTVISSALFLIPITIVDFKNSVIMKRIGVTNVRPWQFLMLIIGLFVIQSTFSFFYSRFVATMLFGSRLGWSVAFPKNVAIGYLYTIMTMVLAISIGMMIASISPTVRRVTMISNILYFPVSMLSGGLIPISILYNSSFLRGLTWINPFKYTIDLYLNQQGAFPPGYGLQTWEIYTYPFIALAIIIFCGFVISKKLKWTS